MSLALHISSDVVLVFIIGLVVAVIHAILCCLHHCCRHRDLSPDDVEAFTIFAEVYKNQNIDIAEDLFELEPDTMVTSCWNRVKCIFFCLPRSPRRAKCPAADWACLSMELGQTVSYVSQLACKIDQALLVYQSQIAGTPIRIHQNGCCCRTRRPKEAVGPHFPAFIVAKEWRGWARTLPGYPPEAERDLLKEIEIRIQWLDEIETGVSHPRISELQKTYGWDTDEEISLLKVFSTVISPTLHDMKNDIIATMLEKSHAELMKSAFYFSKRLISEIIRFLECILHQGDLRVKSFIQSQPAPNNPRWYFWAFLTWPHFARASTHDLEKHLNVRDRDPEWRKLRHMDAVLLSWYSLIKHLLLDDSTPEDESTYDLISTIHSRQQGFWYNFNDLAYGFDYRSYKNGKDRRKSVPRGIDVEPIRDHHNRCLFDSMSAKDFGLSEDDFHELIHLLSFFLSRTLFATNQLATVLLLQASLPLIVGRLFTEELFGKQHFESVLNFAKLVTDQLRYQIQEIKQILLHGWQSQRREQKSSTWSNLGPLDNFRLAMQAKKDIDKLLDDLDFLMGKMQQQMASKIKASQREDIEQVLKMNLDVYVHVWTSILDWRNLAIPRISKEISDAPEWKVAMFGRHRTPNVYFDELPQSESEAGRLRQASSAFARATKAAARRMRKSFSAVSMASVF